MRLPFAPLVAGLALVAAALGPVAAQDATPLAGGATPLAGGATPVAGQDSFEALFVQGFDSATLGEANGDGTSTLTLTGAPAQVAYFADRPNRQVGIIPVEGWVAALGAMDAGDDPPNAALVAETADGGTEIVVVELLGAEGDGADGELTYRVRPLEDLGELELELTAEPLTTLEAGREFGAGHLFIDDTKLYCFNFDGIGPDPLPCDDPSVNFWLYGPG